MNKAFDDFLWKDYPNTNTPLAKRLLNKVNSALKTIDERVMRIFNDEIPNIKNTKLDTAEAYGLVKGISLNEDTGVFTITFYDNTQATIDTMLEKLAVNFDYYADTQKLVIILSDGTQKEVDLSALITQYEFFDSDTVHFSVGSDGKISAIVKEGSIQEKHLRPDYLSDIRVESAKADSSADSAAQKALESANSALLSKSYNGGDTGIREGEDTDNAKYYSEQARQALESLEQAGVTGVKGDAETVYRKGNVNITPDDIGAPSNAYMAEHFVPDYVSSVKKIVAGAGWYRIAVKEGVGNGSSACTIKLSRTYNYGVPEYQEIKLLNSYTSFKFVQVNAYTYPEFENYWTQIRLVKLNDGKYYVDVYNSNTAGSGGYQNEWGVIVENGSKLYEWKALEPYLIDDESDIEKNVTGIGLQANLDAGDYLRSGGRIPTVGKTGYIAYPSDAYYQVAQSNVSGHIRITLPVSWTNTFVKFTVSIFTMGGNESCDYHISGYNYAATPTWSNCTAICTGKPGAVHTNLNVRFGHDGSKCIICIGETNTAWSYPVIQVHDVLAGYYKNDYETWKSGWSIGFGTTLPSTINATVQNTHVAYGGIATKAMQDGTGNNIVDSYAKKSIYGDTAVSLGRKSGSSKGENSFAFGMNVTASGDYSHAEGGYATASTDYSHAEGYNAKANGSISHAEGDNTTANGSYSHAEGYSTSTGGTSAHAEGFYTTATNYASHASGKYNKSMSVGGSASNQVGDVFVIGNGTSPSVLSNALRVTYLGDVMGTKAFQSSGADYAEHTKEWADGNPDGEDRVGYMVTVKGGLLYKAQPGDYIVGITSGNPSVVGNADEDYYWKYERDEFNRIVMEDVPEMVQQTDEDGNLVFDEETHEPVMVENGNIIKNARMKLADDYDPSLQESYIPRAERKEWDYVGMRGIIPVRDDGTCLQDHFCKCGQGGIATLAEERGFDTFYVIERISEDVVSVEI